MAKKRKPTPAKPWDPLVFSHLSEDGGQVWGNLRYTATVHTLNHDDPENDEKMHVVSIHTRTRASVGAHDWRHFQRIKNQLFGEERWAFEIYPAESAKLDTANEYWLWVMPEGFEPGFGFKSRDVSGPEVIQSDPDPRVRKHSRQRKLDDDEVDVSKPLT